MFTQNDITDFLKRFWLLQMNVRNDSSVSAMQITATLFNYLG